ncbi:hypothetical protein [Micromonospora sp. DT47]|uniref:hypothetical protein n=1 Tax=Micromonospora sp. DT47 TaxID=3393431 RepID=UPI003CE8A7B9
MTTIDPDILDVAAVVLGEQRIALTGWQRLHAVQAMTALGHSKTHIAWALNSTKASIEHYGRTNGVALHRYDQRPDWVAIRWVTHHGARLKLKGPDQVEAVRGLAARGHHQADIADRLHCSVHAVTTIADELGITLPAAHDFNWYAYVRGYDRKLRQAVAA